MPSQEDRDSIDSKDASSLMGVLEKPTKDLLLTSK